MLLDSDRVARLMKKLPTSFGIFGRFILLFARAPLVVFLPVLVGIVGEVIYVGCYPNMQHLAFHLDTAFSKF